MFRRTAAIVVVLLTITASNAMAQYKVQASVFGGYTFSDGVTGDAIKAGNGNTYNGIDVKDSANWGLTVGVNVTPNVEVGFLFGQQMSKLAVTGSTSTDVGNLTINSYFPYVAYNLGESDARTRPYILLGIGATSYGSVNYTKASGAAASTGSNTQFAGTIGAGVKVFPSPKVGVQFGFQWTPTYIKSDATGVWCDPWWGCFVTSTAQYSNQFQFNGGITFRF
jgi:opacity protein-like surface antigen